MRKLHCARCGRNVDLELHQLASKLKVGEYAYRTCTSGCGAVIKIHRKWANTVEFDGEVRSSPMLQVKAESTLGTNPIKSKHCYVCDKATHELSPRGRCVDCEYDRSTWNEKENECLRAVIESLENKIADILGGKR